MIYVVLCMIWYSSLEPPVGSPYMPMWSRVSWGSCRRWYKIIPKRAECRLVAVEENASCKIHSCNCSGSLNAQVGSSFHQQQHKRVKSQKRVQSEVVLIVCRNPNQAPGCACCSAWCACCASFQE
jgi:hypothetical protein